MGPDAGRLGAGQERHVPVYGRVQPHPRQCRGVLRRAWLEAADSLDEILADPEIDAVVFATPHSEHGAQVERAAAAGKHVFMEKPFTLDRHSAARALDAVARAGVVLGVAYPRRFHPNMRELKRRIDDGLLGTIAHCYAEQNRRPGCSWTRARGAPIPQRRRPAG